MKRSSQKTTSITGGSGITQRTSSIERNRPITNLMIRRTTYHAILAVEPGSSPSLLSPILTPKTYVFFLAVPSFFLAVVSIALAASARRPNPVPELPKVRHAYRFVMAPRDHDNRPRLLPWAIDLGLRRHDTKPTYARPLPRRSHNDSITSERLPSLAILDQCGDRCQSHQGIVFNLITDH